MRFLYVIPLLSFAVLMGIIVIKTAILGRRGIKTVADITEAPMREWLIKRVSMVVWWSFGLAALIFAIDPQPAWLPAVITFRLIDSTALQIVGAILCVLGAGLYPFAQADMGKVWRIGIDHEVGQGGDGKSDLVTGGLFALSRNPIYVMMDAVFAGAFLIHGTVIFLIIAIAYIATAHFEILDEERFLADRFGDDYAAYKARVGRYVPGI